ncbi:hypothetical protein, partial [Burkholderia cenocepacia]|uniref:hypothetical protein n=1 Tax=Burkholderia cenocepacia TaxID=95486 RepID=UPI00222E60C4
ARASSGRYDRCNRLSVLYFPFSEATPLSPSKRTSRQKRPTRLSPSFFSSIAVPLFRRKALPDRAFRQIGATMRPLCRHSDGSKALVYRRNFGHLSTEIRVSSSIAVSFLVYRRSSDSSIAVSPTRLSPMRREKKDL